MVMVILWTEYFVLTPLFFLPVFLFSFLPSFRGRSTLAGPLSLFMDSFAAPMASPVLMNSFRFGGWAIVFAVPTPCHLEKVPPCYRDAGPILPLLRKAVPSIAALIYTSFPPSPYSSMSTVYPSCLELACGR